MKRFLHLAPLVIAGLRLLDDAFLGRRILPDVGALAFVIIVLAPLLGAVGLRPPSIQRGATAACLVAPLAVLGSWAAMPGSIFPTSANLETFLSWTTRYPNLGPINYEVLLGLGCVLTSSFAPWIFAVSSRLRRNPAAAGVAAALQLCSFSAVFWRLDRFSFLLGGIWVLSPAWTYALHMAAGALGRLVGTVGLVYTWRRDQESAQLTP